MSDRKAAVLISPDLLIEALNLPECEIVGSEWDFGNNCLKLYLESDEFPEIADGCAIPNVMVEFETTRSKFVL